MAEGATPTAVAVSTLDVCTPTFANPGHDYAHWGLTHFLLDGHHKLEAASRAARPLTLLSLLSVDASLASAEQLQRAVEVRRLPASRRDPGTNVFG
jgi:hypothetical protein